MPLLHTAHAGDFARFEHALDFERIDERDRCRHRRKVGDVGEHGVAAALSYPPNVLGLVSITKLRAPSWIRTNGLSVISGNRFSAAPWGQRMKNDMLVLCH